MILDRINKENDIKEIPHDQLQELAEEIRSFLIGKLSETGGHLASNLGVVELTMALHLVFTLPEDKLIWDVGHQAYTHKLLTGRREGFDDLRKLGGMSGFPKRSESACDAFDTGHSSTSVSAGLGIASARDLAGEHYHVVSIIGDGSFTGGMVYEALNNASRMKTNFIIVLNDNGMSIAENVGGFASYLSGLRTNDAYTGLKKATEDTLRQIPIAGEWAIGRIRHTKNNLKTILMPGSFFEQLGITYFGPVDGSNIDQMVQVLQHARKVQGAVEISTGLPKNRKVKSDWTDIFSTVMCKMGKRVPKLCAITAAMPDGTGLKRFGGMYPDRFFDVGIAEQHAVTFAAGLAVGGMVPVVAVYSSFLQRAFDQIIHDVCLQNLHVVFAIDRGGLVGADGETHQGIFDLSYLSLIPNMTIMAPKNKWELADMLKWAITHAEGPVAIRYPRGTASDFLEDHRAPVEKGRWEIIYDEREICLLAAGSMVGTALKVRERLRDCGYSCSLINARFVKPLDEEMLLAAAKDHKLIVTLEENVRTGGFGDHVLEFLSDVGAQTRVINIALPDEYIEHGNVDVLYKETLLDEDSILKKIIAEYAGMEE